MPKARQTEINELADLSYFLTIKEIVDKMGFSKKEVESWFKEPSFPCIRAGVMKVDKYNLIEWLQKNKGNSRASYINPERTNDQLQEDIRALNENVELLLKGGQHG